MKTILGILFLTTTMNTVFADDITNAQKIYEALNLPETAVVGENGPNGDLIKDIEGGLSCVKHFAETKEEYYCFIHAADSVKNSGSIKSMKDQKNGFAKAVFDALNVPESEIERLPAGDKEVYFSFKSVANLKVQKYTLRNKEIYHLYLDINN